MRKPSKFLLISLCLLALNLPMTGGVQAERTPQLDEPDSGAVVCAPDVYWVDPEYCAPLGPSRYLTELSRLGLTIPPRPLPAYKPDPNLGYLPDD